MAENSAGASGRRGKVSRLLDEYDVPELGDELEARWTAEDDRQSLRNLADYVNRRLVRVALESTDGAPLDGEVENVYRLLTDDDVSAGDRTQLRRRLERAGVDVDALDADFVSRQAVHTYLRSERGVTAPDRNEDPLTTTSDTIQRLRRRTDAVTTSRLARLQDAGHLRIGDFTTTVDVRVFCEDCGRQYAVADLLDDGSCACHS